MNYDSDSHTDVTNCLDCGAAVSYHYCAVCGQETKLHVPSAREFLHEFVGHYVALEGKLWRSLGLLLFGPGRLTAEYIAGRRARYVQPLRIYLTFSILFFALFKYGGVTVANMSDEAPSATRSTELRKDGSARVDKPLVKKADSAEFRQAVDAVSPAWGDKVDRFEALPNSEKGKLLTNAFFNYAPYAMFCLMPVFAFYLKLLYLGSGRRYGEHLLFALHCNAFAFIMFGLVTVVPESWGFARFVLILWLALYLPLAMWRVYGGGRVATGLRWMVLMALHLGSIAMGILAAFGLAIFA